MKKCLVCVCWYITFDQNLKKIKMKTIKTYGLNLALVKLDKPIFGGHYAVINGDRIKDGLCIDAANDLFNTLKKLSR